MKNGMTFWDVFYQSSIIQAIIALATIGAVIYLAIIQVKIPDILSNTAMAIIGFYFGQKVAQQHYNNVQAMLDRINKYYREPKT